MLAAPALQLQPSTSTPIHSIPNTNSRTNIRRLPAPQPSISLPSHRIKTAQKAKAIETISIRAYHSSGLPWTYAPNQYALKINDTLFVLALEIDHTTSEPVGLKFNFTRFEEGKHEYEVTGVVGGTKLNVEQLVKLGYSVLDSFESYQSVWWNCQAFLNLYLGIITEGNHKAITIPSSVLRDTAFATMFSQSSRNSKLEERGMGSEEMKVERRRATA